jgi:hypothetical protein
VTELQTTAFSGNHNGEDKCLGEKFCTSTTISSTLIEKSAKDVGDNCDSSSNGGNNESLARSQNGLILLGANCDRRNPSDSLVISQIEAKLLAIVSTFLHVHPFGASLDYIWSYTQKVVPSVGINQLESSLVQFPSLFKQEISGIGASLERKWNFIGFS